MRRVEVIAEAASCHDGSVDKALRLIQVAKESGANLCRAPDGISVGMVHQFAVRKKWKLA